MSDDEEEGVLPFPKWARDPSLAQTEAVAWSDANTNPLEAIRDFEATMRRRKMRLARPDDEEALAQLGEIIAEGGRLACASDVYRRILADLTPEQLEALGGAGAVFEAPLLPAGTVAAVPRGFNPFQRPMFDVDKLVDG